MKNQKPKIFISSTIYDFKDLRSALKYYFESLGFNVQLSDHNDFEIGFDKNSYEECLKNIEFADYFILLIGARIGGFYDEKNKITITRKEYEKAIEQLEKGKLKVIILVREDIWTIKDDRGHLDKFLKNELLKKYEISEGDIIKLKNHESNYLNNAEITFDFLKQVGRIEEMKAAANGKGNFPKGNWINKFNDFNDIIDVLKKEFNFQVDIETNTLINLLKEECMLNLSKLFFKRSGNIYPINIFGSNARLVFKGDINDSTTISGGDIELLKNFFIFGIGKSSKLSTEFITHSILSGKFFKYDNTTDNLADTELSKALLTLKYQINELKEIELLNNVSIEKRLQFVDSYRNIDKNSNYDIKNSYLIIPFTVYDLIDSIIKLLLAILNYLLNGGEELLKLYKPVERSPIKEYSDKLKNESVTDDDILDYLKKCLENFK